MSSDRSKDALPALRVAAALAVLAFAAFMFLRGDGSEKPDVSVTDEKPKQAKAETEEQTDSSPSSPEPAPDSGTISVEVIREGDGRWKLLRAGEPYFVKGAGTEEHLEELAESGGNSIRTWGINEETGALLDRAHALGLTVTLGHWLGHSRHGFDYGNEEQVARQLEQVKAATAKYKDHPALLAWGVGNEAETGQHDNLKIWKAIEEAAAAIKTIDPHHPTVCVVAELGPGNSNVRHLADHCPSVEIYGINTYDGATSAAARLAAAGIDKPCLLTEYGPPLPQPRLKLEPTSTEKGEIYREIYEKGIQGQSNCLGGYSFLWGAKLEGTDTYFGQFLASGERLAGAEVFRELFEGSAPANRAPVVEALQIDPPTQAVIAGKPITVSWEASDPDSDELTYRWELKNELAGSIGGDRISGNAPIADAIQAETAGSARIVHSKPGNYRLYVYAFDGQGNAATASARITIQPDIDRVPSPKAKLPFALYSDRHFTAPFHPSGYQGPVAASIRLDVAHAGNPHSGATCVRASTTANDNWVGLSLQSPPDDWGSQPGGLDFTGASRMTLWARGEKGGEKITVALGNIPNDQLYHDTAIVETPLQLTNEWQKFTMDLTGVDLSRIKTPLVWSANTGSNGLVFYFDEIIIE